MRLYWVGRDMRPGPETASRFLIKFLIKFSADTDILVSTYLQIHELQIMNYHFQAPNYDQLTVFSATVRTKLFNIYKL